MKKTLDENLFSLQIFEKDYKNKVANSFIGKDSDSAIFGEWLNDNFGLFLIFVFPLVIVSFAFICLIYSPSRTLYFALCLVMVKFKLNSIIYKKIKQDRDVAFFERNIIVYREKSSNVFKRGHSSYSLFAKWISEHTAREVIFFFLSFYTLAIFMLLFALTPIRKLLFIKRIRKLEKLGRAISI